MRSQQATRIDARQQVLHSQERMNLRGIEPKTWEFILIANMLVLGLEPVGMIIPLIR